MLIWQSLMMISGNSSGFLECDRIREVPPPPTPLVSHPRNNLSWGGRVRDKLAYNISHLFFL